MTYWNDPLDFVFTKRMTDMPRINVGHNKEELILQVSLPGFSRSDVDVEVTAGRLSVNAKTKTNTQNYEFTTRGFKIADYSQTWTLPKNVNADSVSANYEAGILTITMPFANNTRDSVRKIELN